MAGLSRPRARRDFILDSGGLTALAYASQQSTAWLKHIATKYDAPAIIVPTVVLTESMTGYPTDAAIHQFLKRIDDPANRGGSWAIEARSHHCGVTILTSDEGDIQQLVDQTRRSNIAVEVV